MRASIERAYVRRPDLIEPDDVVAELRLDRIADLPGLHPEQCIGKRRDIGALLGPAQIAALRRRTRIGRILFGESSRSPCPP